MTAAVDVIEDCERAHAMLSPARLQLLEHLAEPASAASLARQLGLPRQRVNYHLRELEQTRLVEVVEERHRGSVSERIYRRTGHTYAIATTALGRLGTTPDEVHDRFSAAYQIALASRAVADLGALQAGARAAGKKLPTMALDTQVRFASAAARDRFAEELAQAVTELVRRHHDARAPRGRTFRFYLGAYPKRHDAVSSGTASAADGGPTGRLGP